MSTFVPLRDLPEEWLPFVNKPLDEAVWRAWVSKGRVRECRRRAARLIAAEWVSVAALIFAAMASSPLGAYDVVLRFVVAFGAIFVMLQFLHVNRYSFAAVFAIIALLYNPVAPLIGLVGFWERALLVASSTPFLAAFAFPVTEI